MSFVTALPAELASAAGELNHRLCRSRQEYGRDDRDDSVRLDLSYVENWSMLSDLGIAAKTVGAVCRGSGAY